jgi:hypothetical protein
MGASTPDGPPSVIAIDLPASSGAPHTARALAERLSDLVSEPRLQELSLLLSETVSDAVRRAGDAPGATIRVRLRLRDGTVLAEVVGRADRPVHGWPRGEDDRSMTFALLDRLANRWGYAFGGPVAVWFELPA